MSAQTESSSQLACGSLSEGESRLKKNLKLMDELLLTTSSIFLELRKYQKLLEPPPSAKPITADVDRKLEDGQKVTPSLLQKGTLVGQRGCQFKTIWSCCLRVFK